ncbi:MAG TPA: hypothetical protein VE958_09005, partial [Bryobacteraceae bacterium]|nr:hypothetical protein [Bryobacteraceae bacterium]
MPNRFVKSLIASLVVLSPLLAQHRIAGNLKPGEMEARFHDGTLICKMEVQQDLEVVTKDGKLMVLAGDIHRLEPGLRLSAETAARITQAVDRLGDVSFAVREAAAKELLVLGYRAYPPLLAVSKSADLEVAKRAATALNKIRETAAPESLEINEHDLVITRNRQRITGRILASTIKVRSPSVGEISLNLADLRSLAHTKGEIRVGAGLFTQPIPWQDTGFVVESDTGLIIRASGEIIHPTGFGIQLATGPEGRFGGDVHTDAHPPGTLVGKIGDQSDHFVVGKHLDIKPGVKGRLFLWVVPWVKADKSPTGFYRVEIEIGIPLGAQTKRLTPYNNETEAALAPFNAVRGKRIREVVEWTEAMNSPAFNPAERWRYEAGIR